MEKMYLVGFSALYASLLALMPIFTVKNLPLASGQTTTPSGNSIDIFPTDSMPYNLTYGDWSAKWWQWALSIPADINPILDNTGENRSVNQTAPVWFLAGTTGGSAELRCAIPEGMAIFFPIPLLKTESELRALGAPLFDQVRVVEATIDGVKLENLENHRVQSLLFNFTYPENNIGGILPGPSQAIAEGYWVMLNPLPVGGTSIHFRGGIVDPTVTGAINFVTEVIYHLTMSNSTNNTNNW